jgi:hypothetical protein
MSNTHEYVVFDRAKLDPALAMRWPGFDDAYPGWGQWGSARDFLVDWALDDESQIDAVDEILSRKTVRETLAMSGSAFHALWAILSVKRLSVCTIEIPSGDFNYAEDIVCCAGTAFVRGDISLATLAAVYQLHASRVDPADHPPPNVVSGVLSCPKPASILPGVLDEMPAGVDGIGIMQTRKVIGFLCQAWREQWPLQADQRTSQKANSLRTCEVAKRLATALRNRRLLKPCMIRWFEC